VEDIARSFLQVMQAPIESVHGQAFNNGAAHLNHQIIQLAQIVVDTVPGCDLEVRGEAGADQRTYQADFSKFARTVPDFEFKWTPASGAEELYQAFKEVGLTHDDFLDRRFTRLKWLNYLLESGRLDGALRWRSSEVVPT
jgi:nucleoside-diphosphate-sugar epimerase